MTIGAGDGFRTDPIDGASIWSPRRNYASNVSRYRLLVVVAIAVLAGCSGFADDPARDPYGVDDPLESAIVDAESISGLTEDGFRDATFVREHRRALENTSYTQYATQNATTANGTILFDRGESHAVGAGREPARSVIRYRGTETPYVWAAGQEVVVDRWYEEHSRIQRIDSGNRSPGYSVQGDMFDVASVQSVAPALVAAAETELDAANGRTVVTATEPGAESGYLASEPFRAEVVIREDGLVERASLEGTVRRDGDPVEQHIELWITDVGETDPERPTWYEEAVEELDSGGA